jgi:hypothetical protein
MKMENPSRLEQVMLNVTRGSNHLLLPLAEVLTPNSSESP